MILQNLIVIVQESNPEFHGKKIFICFPIGYYIYFLIFRFSLE